MASTGFIRAAILAGYKEDITQIKIINVIGSKTISNETLALHIGSITTPPKERFPWPLTSNPYF